MPEYGKLDYWNNRYANEKSSSPFDWLFNYNDVKTILNQLIPDKNEEILIVGSGNAPFSPDLYDAGHKRIINIDISDVVIEQQKIKYPEQEWIVMDVLDLKYETNSIMLVIDKSLIDTLLCYSDGGHKFCASMIDEIYRVMKPGSRYVTFSLHSLDEAEIHFTKDKYDWKVSSYLVKSSRWNDNEDRHRAVCYTMIVCDKRAEDGCYYMNQTYPMQLEGTLSEEEYIKLRDHALEVNKIASVKAASVKRLKKCLHNALLIVSGENEKVKSSSETIKNVSM